MSEVQPQLHGLMGLERLSTDDIQFFDTFVDENDDAPGVAHLRERYLDELATMALRDLEGTRAKVSAWMAEDGGVYGRIFAAHVTPGLAAQDPDVGFSLWRKLIRDESDRVSNAAFDALVRTVGRLALDPEQVAEMMYAHMLREDERADPGYQPPRVEQRRIEFARQHNVGLRTVRNWEHEGIEQLVEQLVPFVPEQEDDRT
jgi:hypothetical protein